MRRLIFGVAIATTCALAVFSGARLYAQGAKPPDPSVLKTLNSPIGPVTFNHTKHASKEGGAQCTDCHHASKPAQPLKAAQQKCSDCHTKPAKASCAV